MVLLHISTNDCVTFCHSNAFLLNFTAVTAGWRILFITSSFVFYYLTMVIPNMILSSINYDATIVRCPCPANYCFASTLFFSLFVYFSSPFLYVISLVLLILLLLFWYGLELGFSLLVLSTSFLLATIDCWIYFHNDSWSCRNLMVDLLTNSLFWIAS